MAFPVLTWHDPSVWKADARTAQDARADLTSSQNSLPTVLTQSTHIRAQKKTTEMGSFQSDPGLDLDMHHLTSFWERRAAQLLGGRQQRLLWVRLGFRGPLTPRDALPAAPNRYSTGVARIP